MNYLVTVILLAGTCALGQTSDHAGQSQASPIQSKDPKTWDYTTRSLARVFGNVGGWWSMMNENDKAAFLDGYQFAMAQALSQNRITCKLFMDRVKSSSGQQALIDQITSAAVLCDAIKDFSGFDKLTTKDLDKFYSEPVNQPILLEWAMPYLRDKVTGRKTAGQLINVLQAEQKD
jgi:hypothetical protein